jgi:N-acetyl-alpha-D-muramate 1-phosphate uridylyltransferase
MANPRSPARPRHAMVLAAGLGTRMRPITERMPKPLIKVGGKALIDHALDRLTAADVELAVVNIHHFPDQMHRHLASRRRPRIIVSDERDQLLGTGGGAVNALSMLGPAPFYHVNSDTIWVEGVTPNLDRLAAAFDPALMDALLLLAPTATSIGYEGRGDFSIGPDGRLAPRAEREVVPFVYAGVAIFAPALFEDAPEGPFPLSLLFARANAAGRLHGLRLDGIWIHVGAPNAIAEAEAAILASAA